MKTAIAEPARIARLEHDKRGYPIPWNVLRGTDGHPFFIINDDRKAYHALLRDLCPICGERLGRWKWFVGGPPVRLPPGWLLLRPAGSSHECIEYALQVCPYLAIPKYLRHVPTPSRTRRSCRSVTRSCSTRPSFPSGPR